MYIDLTEEDVIVLQKTTEDDVIYNHNNKRKPDGKLKDATEPVTYRIPCFWFVYEENLIWK